MSVTVWLLARTLDAHTAGGHIWVYLNWALGLRALGCDVVWLELADPTTPRGETQHQVQALKRHLAPFGLGDSLALGACDGALISPAVTRDCVDFEAAEEADLLVDMAYGPSDLVARFRRTALLDIDPGLCQLWISRGQVTLAPHDTYFTIGETVGRPDARFPDCGLTWEYTPPCVALDWWQPQTAPVEAPFTTVSNWIMYDYWVDDDAGGYANDKRTGFLPFLDLPRHTAQPLELALSLGGAVEEQAALEQRGWRVREAHEIVATPQDYQRYIAGSRGEFSCAKPSCVRLQNAWVSDRTLCYLASAKPAVVQHTGPSRFLPEEAGLFRFHDVNHARRCLETVAADYDRQCRLARTLAAEYFDARKVVCTLLERALS
jgi:hypothetical protein